jgi:hypothetical protein
MHLVITETLGGPLKNNLKKVRVFFIKKLSPILMQRQNKQYRIRSGRHSVRRKSTLQEEVKGRVDVWGARVSPCRQRRATHRGPIVIHAHSEHRSVLPASTMEIQVDIQASNMCVVYGNGSSELKHVCRSQWSNAKYPTTRG